MVFNSAAFILFFAVFFVLYWFVFQKNLRAQNFLVLAGSYFFYGWCDWRFLFLIAFSSFISYALGIKIANTENEARKKTFLGIGLITCLGFLLYFKYSNFFIQSFSQLLHVFGFNGHVSTLKIILPLGISFYTFKVISYLLDIYKEKIEPTKDPIVYFSYVGFFTTLISGPIDRASQFIPQLQKIRVFSALMFSDGMRQILYGLFKKVVIADNCAIFSDYAFENLHTLSASSLLAGVFCYTLQLYCDFSGYSDMAIGIGKLLGFKSMKNFDFPYYSQNIAEYWRKWHISLTTWLTEYIFTPLSIKYRDLGNNGLIIAIVVTFLVSGLWHGANWTFVVWGAIHGIYYIPLILSGAFYKNKKIAKDKKVPSLKEFANMLGVFLLVMLTNVFFKADTIEQGISFFASLFSPSLFSMPALKSPETAAYAALLFIPILLVAEWLQRHKDHGLQIEHISRPFVRYSVYFGLVLCIIFIGAFSNKPFIYFKF